MYGIHQVYIADGFIDDVEELIHRCLQRQDIVDFQSFCMVWKEMDLGCMYKGRTSGAEVAELSEEVLQIAKHYMVANTSNYEESVAGLFLVYSLLNLQPYPGFAALRLVPEDVAAIRRLEAVARRDRRHDVLYILASVLIKGPCQFHAAGRERGMEAPIRKYLDGFKSIDNVRGVLAKGVLYQQNEELDIIRELGALTKRYTEAKEAIIGTGPPDRNLQYITGEMPLEMSSLRKIINGAIDEEDDDDDDGVLDDAEPGRTDDHHNLVESIKFRAMKGPVNPIKHLMGVEDRKRSANTNEPPVKGDTKSKSGKHKTSSPMMPSGNRSKRSKGNLMTDLMDEPDETSQEVNEFQVDIFPEEEDQSEEEVVLKNADGTPMDVEIGYLPSLIRTDDTGQIVQIEIIDKNPKKTPTKLDVIQLNNMPDLDAIEPQPGPAQLAPSSYECSTSSAPVVEEYDLTDNDQPANSRPRILKKTRLRSKLKRLGILPMADFEESQ